MTSTASTPARPLGRRSGKGTRPLLRRAAAAVLDSPVGTALDALAAPHGIDRYLELVDPLLVRDSGRAVVTDVRRETPDTTTLTLRPNRWAGHMAGQFVEVGVELDGRRQTRCYSVSSSAHRGDGQFTITVKADPQGLVSPHLVDRIGRGTVVSISAPMGDFTLPGTMGDRPERLLLVSGGSGITPVLSMLRTLVDEDAPTDVTFLHYARTPRDLAFVDELWELHTRRDNVHVVVVMTGQNEGAPMPFGGPVLTGHLEASHIDAVLGDLSGVPVFVCGPASLLDAATDLWERAGLPELLHLERFQPVARVVTAADAIGGTITLTASQQAIVDDGRTILEQAEAAGLTPRAGCRMGICHTCITPLAAGQVRDVRDGRLSPVAQPGCDPQDVQLCVSVPVGDVTFNL